MNSNSNNELETLYSKHETRDPTSNMMIWMKHYDKICNKFCCISIDCGSIKCSGCLTYLTGYPPSIRYQCIECEILPPETVHDSRPEVCEKCFINPNLLHQHSKWLKIDEKGNHSIEIRTFGVAELKEVTKADFPIVENVNTDCAICSEKFSSNNPAVCKPGCINKHGEPIKDKLLGLIDSKSYTHFDCQINWLKYSKRNTYCGKIQFCNLCLFEEEMREWRSQFNTVFVKIKNINDNDLKDLNLIYDFIHKKVAISFSEDEKENLLKLNKLDNIKKSLNDLITTKLIELHPQEWIRTVIKETFTL